MYYNGKKYYHVFTSGAHHGKMNVTDDMLRDIARNYDPANFHEAPVWLGHPEDHDQGGSNEPKALAWIDEVLAVGNKLYVSFSYISDEMKSLIDAQSFKRVSIEIVKYNTDDGKELPYLYAVGLTNRPAVKGLEPISFAGKTFNYNYSERSVFNEKFQNYNDNKMNQYLIKIAELFGLDVSKFTTESSLQEAITVKFNEFKTSPGTGDPGSDDEENELAKLKTQYSELQEERVSELVDSAIKDLKILPAKRQEWIDLAKTNYTIAKQSINNMSVHKDLVSKVISGGKESGLTDEKFKKTDGSKYTYREFLKLDPVEQSKFTPEEVAELKKTNY